MTNGQLMGSILSFPILCLANLAVYLETTTDYQRGWSDKRRLSSVLINGDDMLYVAPESLWDVHKWVASQVGLELSVGKAYCHDVYANVNSQSVHFDLGKEGSTPHLINFLIQAFSLASIRFWVLMLM
jgi:hypothetical protein